MFEDHALRAKCIVPFLLFPHHALYAPMGHLNEYRLILLIWQLARGGQLWSTKEAHTFWPLNTASRSFAACK